MRKLFIAISFLVMAVLAAQEHKPYTRNVAIVVYENAEPLDWTGPYEVYNDAANFGASNGQPAFNVYIVSKTRDAVNAQGLKVVPNYSIDDAPKPDIVIFPGGPSAKIYDDPQFFAWARKASAGAEIAQSVCTGAFVLAKAGMLDNLEVTTWHDAIERLQKTTPNARVENGRRFVDNGHVVTTAGISAGIDGSLHVVARLLGRRIADQVAAYMEYHWTPEAYLLGGYAYLNPSTNAAGRAIQSGDMAYEEKRLDEAEAIFRGVVKSDPSNSEAWSDLGVILRAKNDHPAAADAFAAAATRAVEKRSIAMSSYNAAIEYARADRVDDAARSLRKAFDAGMPGREAVMREPALAKLKDDPRISSLIVGQ